MRLYDDLTGWYRLLTPPEEYVEEAATYLDLLRRACRPEALLELGAGAGHNACHLKAHVHCTLTDVSEPMLALSRELNPHCEHELGDMRTLRLGRTFDAVLVHDAVMYMTSEADLRAAVETAFVHTRSGGAALFAPDCIRETFGERHEAYSGAEGERALRCLEWAWDPDPSDDTIMVDYAFLLRDGVDVRAVHDRHVEGLFSRATWLRILERAGFMVEIIQPESDETADELFLCKKP